MTVRELDVAIQQALSRAQAPVEANRFRVSDLKHSLNEFFESLEAGAGRARSADSRTQYATFVMDADPSQPASFVVVAASPEQIELVVGHGDAEEINAQSPPALLERYAAKAESVQSPRRTLVAWSGYDPE